MLRGLHKGIAHVGKVPEGLMAQQVLHQRLEELRARLDQSISSESYEEAAGIRDPYIWELQDLVAAEIDSFSAQ